VAGAERDVSRSLKVDEDMRDIIRWRLN